MLLKVGLHVGMIKSIIWWSSKMCSWIDVLNYCILFDCKTVSEVILEHGFFFHALLQTSVLGEIADQEHSPSLSTPLGENRAVVRPLSPARSGFWQHCTDSGELQVLRLKISGGLVKRRQLLPPVGRREESCWLPKWCFSVILGGGRLWEVEVIFWCKR